MPAEELHAPHTSSTLSIIDKPTDSPQASTMVQTPNAQQRVAATMGIIAIPGYEIIRKLGEGGMGTVYLARDLKLKREVALKTLRASDARPELVARFWAEAEVMAAVRYHVARGNRFTGERVRQLLARFGQRGIPAGVRDASETPGVDEYWLPDLAKRLGVKPIVVHRWRWSRWLHARQLRGENGRCVVWANAAEVERLSQLRAFEMKYHGRRTPPSKLTTPAKRGRLNCSTTRAQNGGN